MSNLGNVKSLKFWSNARKKYFSRERILKPSKARNGYLIVVLCNREKKTGKLVHRLVAEAFVPNPENKSQVNHIDGNKINNKVENLEFVTAKENTNKAYEIGLKRTGKYLYNTRWIYQFDLNMCFVKKWESMTQASKELGINQADISKCCAGKRNQCGNYIWLNDDGLLKLLEKKDKIIDLMAIVIGNEPLPTEEYCIFRNFDCPVVGGNRDCKDCIKQYFENKVKE